MVERISLAHGEGGELTNQLIKDVFISAFQHQEQTQLDAAIITCDSEKMAVTTDSFVIKPIFFPGGNIGKLAIAGTVNDLAVSGAIPKVITAGFIIEEGFPILDLKVIVESMAEEARKAGVKIVAGDTKVVEKGSVDGLFINTTGIGVISKKQMKPEMIKEGDAVIISGPIGDHGIAILSARQDLGVISDVSSDCASLQALIHPLVEYVDGIRIMRDPTRGGLATTLVELCEDYKINIELDEAVLPIRKEVEGACDILGFDPLYLANEGKVTVIVNSNSEQKVLELLHQHELGREARIIGRVTTTGEKEGKLLLKTPIGITRRLQRLTGLLLPRIC